MFHYEAANTLVKNGFKDVLVLQVGIFNIGWTAANIKGFASLAKLKTGVSPKTNDHKIA